MAEIVSFSEHDVTITGEDWHLLDYAKFIEGADLDNVWTDLAYKIRYELDEDFRKSIDSESDPALVTDVKRRVPLTVHASY